jgi:hypothetical protein
MEIYNQPEDIVVFGVQVKTFPNGIKGAFESLMKTFGNRTYYGISWFGENDSIKYYAMVPEAFEDEAKQYDYETLLVRKGEYYTETLYHWLSKVDSIREVFHELMPGHRPDENHPCVEWYVSGDEMLCMIKVS